MIVIAALLFAAIIGGVIYIFSGPTADDLLGTWTNEDTALVFMDDGTWSSHPKDKPEGLLVWGTYHLVGTSETVMHYANPPYPALKHTHKIEFTGSMLTLHAYNEDPREFTR